MSTNGPPAADVETPAEARCAAWAAGHLAGIGAGALRHERRVADVAAAAFDLAGPLHHLGPQHRQLLRLAALLHDVGRSVTGGPEHAAIGAAMVAAAAGLPLAPADRRALAYLAKFHRGPVPPPGEDWTLAPPDDAAAARVLLGLLRLADALDSRNDGPPGRPAPGGVVLSLDGRVLSVDLFDADPPDPSRWAGAKRKKFAPLEEALGVSVVVTPRRAEAVRVVP